ncbi:hypothetical protein CXB51_017765 [Gossypium anomalum]|uniref:Uncharacterized protein n=1 Tax=Gossypium anomalum TaxID=47600 RepID=A0A8J6D129_9ROSI|nr:hypothetical protein CXB51_017765 [Gossypium anomalum]
MGSLSPVLEPLRRPILPTPEDAEGRRLSAPFLSPTSATEKGSPMSQPWGISGVRRPSEARKAAMTEAWWPRGGEKFSSSMLGARGAVVFSSLQRAWAVRAYCRCIKSDFESSRPCAGIRNRLRPSRLYAVAPFFALRSSFFVALGYQGGL